MGTVALMIIAALIRGGAGAAIVIVLLITAVATVAASQVGLTARKRAACPVTKGAAIDVPLQIP